VTCPSVCMSVTLMHPAKANGRNEMPFDRDILVVSANTVLDRGPGLSTGRGDLRVGTPQFVAVIEKPRISKKVTCVV